MHYGLLGDRKGTGSCACAEGPESFPMSQSMPPYGETDIFPLLYRQILGQNIFITATPHFSTLDRKLNKEGVCWFVPVQFRENPKLYAENVDGRIDVAMFQTAPMDAYGNFNFGPQIAEYWGILEKRKP